MVQTATEIEREVLAADKQRVKALLSNDIAALEDLLADDLTYVHSNGMLDTKASYIDALRSGASRYLTMDMSDLVVRVYGETALVTGTFKARVMTARGEVTPNPRVLIVYVKRPSSKGWQMSAWQSTSLPAN